jgi:hypothetical protein
VSDVTAPERGWYPDPAGQADLRLWDGERWTAETRALGSPTGPEDIEAAPQTGGDPTEPELADERGASSRRNAVSTVLGVVLGVFLILGVVEVITGATKGTTNPQAFSPDAGTATTADSSPSAVTSPVTDSAGQVNPACAQRNALIVVARLSSQHRLPVKVVPKLKPIAPAGDYCSTVLFSDQRGIGTDQLTVYPTNEAALAAAQEGPSTASAVDGTIVVDLAPSLAPYRTSYTSALAGITGSG